MSYRLGKQRAEVIDVGLSKRASGDFSGGTPAGPLPLNEASTDPLAVNPEPFCQIILSWNYAFGPECFSFTSDQFDDQRSIIPRLPETEFASVSADGSRCAVKCVRNRPDLLTFSSQPFKYFILFCCPRHATVVSFGSPTSSSRCFTARAVLSRATAICAWVLPSARR